MSGYQSGNGGIDSYGVDHSGFSVRDELEYQSARLARENQLAENFSKQGIAEENYPQFGTNFWAELQKITTDLELLILNNILKERSFKTLFLILLIV